MLTIDDICKGITSRDDFDKAALEVFAFQSLECRPYTDYLGLMGIDRKSVCEAGRIPCLPIGLFKTHKVYCGSAGEAEKVFTSSTTGGDAPSRHYIRSLGDYEAVFTAAFGRLYGDPRGWSIYALLPGYLEREDSSLVYMADRLIARGRGGGFFLYDHDELLARMRSDVNDKKILLGVSYALMDLAERGERLPGGTIVMETGGMKGKRREMSKEELHSILCGAFGVGEIHSEYGMAELTSQAYSQGGGIFNAPEWMRFAVRDANSPLRMLGDCKAGGINVIDLANLYSCAFLQTDDMGRTGSEGRSFEILGRLSGSQTRGCNLMVD